MLLSLLGASIALNLLLLFLWREARWYLSAIVFHLNKRHGVAPDSWPDEMDEDYEEFCDSCTLWDKLFG